MSHHGIQEILESGQFPGIAVRTPVRSAVLRDAAGRTSRVLYAGQEDTGTVDRDMVRLAEQDGLDLATARIEVETERGQGLGKRGNHRVGRLPKRPRFPRGTAVPPDRTE